MAVFEDEVIGYELVDYLKFEIIVISEVSANDGKKHLLMKIQNTLVK
jgi:hypothetical protein